MAKETRAKLLLGLTGWKDEHWKKKIEEINKYNIKEIALFLEMFHKSQREKIYNALLKSKVKRIPLVHLRNDMSKAEISFLNRKFKTRYFNIHESTFKNLNRWNGFHKNFYLEMNSDNRISKKVDVTKIGGFCIDIAHFMIEKNSGSKEYGYILKNSKLKRYFKCNHISGYSYRRNKDVHTIKNVREFDYLKDMPRFVVGRVLGIEVFNTLEEQIMFREYIHNILRKKRFNVHIN